MKNVRDPQLQAQIDDFLRSTKEQQEVFQFVAQVVAVERAMKDLTKLQDTSERPSIGQLLKRAYQWLHPDDAPDSTIIEGVVIPPTSDDSPEVIVIN